MISLVDPAGQSETVERDEFGRGIRYVDDAGRVTIYQYGNHWLPEVVTFPDGSVRRMTYSSLGLVNTITDELGRTTEITYHPDGRVKEVFAPAASANAFAFGILEDSRGRWDYEYDDNERLIGLTDPAGNVVRYEYDALGRRTKTIDALGGTYENVFDPLNQLIRTIDPLGRTTTFERDGLGRVARFVDPTGAESEYEYDADGNLTAAIDALGRRTEFTYDGANRLLTAIDAAGGAMSYTYDAADRVTALTDALGRISQFEYDTLDRLTRTVDPLGRAQSYSYDSLDRLTSFTDPAGNITQFAYDLRDRLTSRTDPLNFTQTWTYDAAGQMTEFRDEAGQSWQYTYDHLRRNTSIVDPLWGETRAEYDAVGNLTTLVDPLGRSVQYVYDALQRVTSETDPLGSVTHYSYDAVGNLTTFVDPLGGTTQYEYDAADRLTRRTDAAGQASLFAYDAVGNLTAATDRRGRVTSYTYDVLDRRTSEAWHDGSNVVNEVAYTYDAVGNLLSAADAYSRYSYTYDALDRTTSVDNLGTPNLPHVVLNFGYDKNGNLNRVADNFGVIVSSTFDARDQLTSRTWTGLPGGASAAVDFAHDARGMLSALERFGDADRTQVVGSTVFDYDELGRLTDLTHRDALDQVLADYDYVRNAASELIREIHHGRTFDYTYDAASRLISVEDSAAGPVTADAVYDYDAAGNRLETSTIVGPANRLLADDRFDYAYDAEGNLTSQTERSTGEITSYVYDHRNRLTAAEIRSAGGIVLREVSYTYDVFDRLISRTVDMDGSGAAPAETTHRIYDGLDIWADFDAAGNVTARYLHGEGLNDLLARWRPGEGLAWYLTDHLGTVRDLVDSSGTLLNHYDYDAYGRLLSQTAPTFGDRFTYTGREYDSALDLYYYRARFYSPSTGRFLSEDPLGFAAGDANLYRYVASHPTFARDPLGLAAWTERSTNDAYTTAALTSKFDCFQREMYVNVTSTAAGGLPLATFQMAMSASSCGVFPAGTNLVTIFASAAVLLKATTVQFAARVGLDDIVARIGGEGWEATARYIQRGDNLPPASPPGGVPIPDVPVPTTPIRDGAGRLRGPDGRFVPDGGKPRQPAGTNHGNSHMTDKPATGYSLQNRDTGAVLKYGETTSARRYSKKYLDRNNADQIPEASGTKAEMHRWQHDKILDYKATHGGHRPPLNKSDY